MKTKTYTFTLEEIQVLRSACLEYMFFLEMNGNEVGAATNDTFRRASALHEQFKEDARLL